MISDQKLAAVRNLIRTALPQRLLDAPPEQVHRILTDAAARAIARGIFIETVSAIFKANGADPKSWDVRAEFRHAFGPMVQNVPAHVRDAATTITDDQVDRWEKLIADNNILDEWFRDTTKFTAKGLSVNDPRTQHVLAVYTLKRAFARLDAFELSGAAFDRIDSLAPDQALLSAVRLFVEGMAVYVGIPSTADLSKALVSTDDNKRRDLAIMCLYLAGGPMAREWGKSVMRRQRYGAMFDVPAQLLRKYVPDAAQMVRVLKRAEEVIMFTSQQPEAGEWERNTHLYDGQRFPTVSQAIAIERLFLLWAERLHSH